MLFLYLLFAERAQAGAFTGEPIRISRFCTMEFLPKWEVREVWDCIAASHLLSPLPPDRVGSNLETAVRLCTL